MAEVLVLGLGNPMMADDGFGAAVIEELGQRGLPRSLRTAVAPDILHLQSIWQGEPRVWLVDAIQRSDDPGTICVLSHSEIVDIPSSHRSAHQLSLPDGLRWLIHSYPEFDNVEFRLWGVEPKVLEPALKLSPEVTSAARKVALTIVAEAAR